MGRLFKVGTGGKSKREKRGSRRDWYCKIRLGPYDHHKARLCSDGAVSESWARMLQAAVDRKNAGEPPDPATIKRLPSRLLASFGLVSELSKRRRGTYVQNVEDYATELATARRDATYVANVRRCLKAVGVACGWRTLPDIERDALATTNEVHIVLTRQSWK